MVMIGIGIKVATRRWSHWAWPSVVWTSAIIRLQVIFALSLRRERDFETAARASAPSKVRSSC